MLGFWISIDQKMSEKTLPQMALFEPVAASAAPEMASTVTEMAAEMSEVAVGNARDWVNFSERCVQSNGAFSVQRWGAVVNWCISW